MSMIGSEVETISGESGVLICSSGMGLSPMDLFNDIFTSRTDLTNFLNDYNCKESDNISLRSVFSSDWDHAPSVLVTVRRSATYLSYESSVVIPRTP